LAAGKAELNRAERARLAQDAQPVTGSEFLAGARELRRVRAVRAMQRAAVRELEQQPQGRPRSSRCQIAGAAAHARISSHLLSTARFTNAVTSPDSPVTPNVCSRSAMISVSLRSPSHRLMISPAL